MLLNSIGSGISIILIIPLLSSVGVDVGDTSTNSGVVKFIVGFSESVGVELNFAFVLGLYLALIILMASLSFANSVVTASLTQSFIIDLRNEMSRSLFYTKWQYLNGQYMSDFMRLLTGQVSRAGACLNSLLSLISSLILVCVYVGFAMMVSIELTALALLCALLLAAALLPFNKRIHKSGGVGLNASIDIQRSIYDNVNSLKVIKSFAAEEKYLARMRSNNTLLESQLIRMAKFNALTRWVNLVGAAVIFTVLFYSSIEWLKLPIANLLVILFIFSRLMPQVSGIQNTVQKLIHQAPIYEDLMRRLSELNQWSEKLDITSDHDAPTFKKEIRIRGFSYKYADKSDYAFKDIGASIRRNETVAIVGPSGAGKSTLADILSGLLPQTSGEIWVDDLLLNDDSRVAWRQKVAYVTQDVFLFHDTVRANLAWVTNGEICSDDNLWRALTSAAADEFVKSLPYGLDSVIGDRGIKLSGGERQRLALARALLSDPDVLILDEATSALDNKNERLIRDALVALEGKLTILIIAHNETTIEHVQNRIVLT